MSTAMAVNKDGSGEVPWFARCIDHEDVITLDRFDEMPATDVLLLKLPVPNSSGCDLRAMHRDSIVRYMQRRYDSGDYSPHVERGTLRKFFQTQVPGLCLDGESWDYLGRALRGPPVDAPTTMHVSDRQLIQPSQILGALQRPTYALEVYVLEEARIEAQFWSELWEGMENWVRHARPQHSQTVTLMEWWQRFATHFAGVKLACQPPGTLHVGGHPRMFDLARWNHHEAALSQALTVRRHFLHFCGDHGLDTKLLNDFWPGMNEITTLREVAEIAALTSEFAVAGSAVTVFGAGSPRVNGVFRSTDEMQLGAPVYKNDNGLYLFRYTLPAWSNVYWYVSWLSNFNALVDPNPMSIRDQWQDFYRARSPSLLPPVDGWQMVTGGHGQMPLPEVSPMDVHQIEIASTVLAAKPDWSGDSSEADNFVRARMPAVLRNGSVAYPHSAHTDNRSEDEESNGAGSRSYRLARIPMIEWDADSGDEMRLMFAMRR